METLDHLKAAIKKKKFYRVSKYHKARCQRFLARHPDKKKEARKVGALIGLENRDGVNSPV